MIEQLDDCKLHYRREGSGPTVLYLHGAGGVPGWTPWMAQLAERFDLIVPDHPGFGASDTPAWFDNIHDLAYSYLDFIEALGLRDVHIVGHSLGGWIAAELAVRSTAALRSLTLVAAAGLRVPGVERVDVFLLAPEDIPHHVVYDRELAASVAAQPKTDEQLDLDLKNSFSFARVAWQPRLYDPHLEKWLHRIKLPTLLLWGDSDRIVPTPHAAEFKRLIPHATVQIIERCGHAPALEHPQTFVAAVSTFVERNAA